MNNFNKPLLSLLLSKKETQESLCVVRLTTSYYQRGSGYTKSKTLTCVKKLCKGFNLLEEDIGNTGEEYVIPYITNLDIVEDGLYKFIMSNVSYDWESGHLDDYDYELVEYEGSEL